MVHGKKTGKGNGRRRGMSDKRGHGGAAFTDRPQSAGYCMVHGKETYLSRDDARKAIRVFRGHGMREYRCDKQQGRWHYGHLPQAVVRGIKTRDEVYVPKQRKGEE